MQIKAAFFRETDPTTSVDKIVSDFEKSLSSQQDPEIGNQKDDDKVSVLNNEGMID